MADRKLRIGIIGAGWAATNRHVPAYERSGLAKVVAVYDHRGDKAQKLGRRVGNDHCSNWAGGVDALEAMLDKEGLDAVSVCSPPWMHAEHASAALRAGINVLIEKPLAMTPDECAAIKAAESATARACVNHNFLFSRSFQRVRKAVDAGEAGEVIGAVGVQLSTPRRRLPDWYGRLPGQLFFDEAPHLTYLSRHFLHGGNRNLSVEHSDINVLHAASVAERDPGAVQRTRQVVYALGSKRAMSTVNMTFNASRAEWILTVVGERKSFVVDLFRDIVVPLPAGGHSPMAVLGQSVAWLARTIAATVASGALYATKQLLYGQDELVHKFCLAVGQGGWPMPVSVESGTDVVRDLNNVALKAGLLAPGEDLAVAP